MNGIFAQTMPLPTTDMVAEQLDGDEEEEEEDEGDAEGAQHFAYSFYFHD